MIISFTVHGTPQPQGSTRAFLPKGWKRPIITTDNARLKPWRQDLSLMASEAMQGRDTFDGAVTVAARFIFAKPKSTKKSVTAKITKPDIDKLVRGALDGMTGIVFRDDSQVVSVSAQKEFGLPERAEISVSVAESR